MDIWSKEKRSQVMSRILARNTGPEQKVRRMLSALGYRFRLHVKSLPGRPDVVLRKYNAVIFVHGCFWHLHSGCRDGTIPKTRVRYWKEKLLGNQQRDIKHVKELRSQGWRVLRLWECEINKKPEKMAEKLKSFIESYNKS